MISLDYQPFSVVEDHEFKQLLKKLQPKYKISGNKYFTNTVIPNTYTKIYEQLLKDIELTSYIAITSDILTANNNNESIISLSVHWLTDDLKKCRVPLNYQHFLERHLVKIFVVCYKT